MGEQEEIKVDRPDPREVADLSAVSVADDAAGDIELSDARTLGLH